MQRQGHGTQVVELHSSVEGIEQVIAQRWVFQEVIQEQRPPFGKVKRGLALVDHAVSRRQSGLNRVHAQDSSGEGVQRLDCRGIEVFGGLGESFAEQGIGLRLAALIQSFEHAVAEFGCGLLGEGDCRDPIGGDLAARDQVDDPAYQRFGLARACAGLNEQGLIEAFADAISLGLIQDIGHG